MSLKQKILEKARRPMQEAGVYDPMEQAGHADMVSVDYVLKQIDGARKQIQEIFEKHGLTELHFKLPMLENLLKDVLAVLDGEKK